MTPTGTVSLQSPLPLTDMVQRLRVGSRSRDTILRGLPVWQSGATSHPLSALLRQV